MSKNQCQIHDLPAMAEPLSPVDVIWQRRNRIRRILKRRMNYLKNMFSEMTSSDKTKPAASVKMQSAAERLKAGDMVRVKSKEEILRTLNRWNQLNRCSFMEEMWPHCGTKQRVLRRVEKFLDERDYLIKKCKGILILDGVMCEGTKDFGACDRACFFFWREEWLEKVDANSKF